VRRDERQRFSASASAPSEAPSNVVATAPDSRHVRISWIPPPVESWNCDDISYELKVVRPEGVAPVRLNRGSTTHVFDAQSLQHWTVQMRTVNSGGASGYSNPASASTPPSGDFIQGPTVTQQQNIAVLQWQSVAGVEELVQGYRVELRGDRDSAWRPHSSGMVTDRWDHLCRFLPRSCA
jgi:hypothetical protein